MIEKYNNYSVMRENILPIKVLKSVNVNNLDVLFKSNAQCISFSNVSYAQLVSKGAYLLLDFGKELCGGIRILTKAIEGSENAKIKVVFGESVTEAISSVQNSNATNDHAPREFSIMISSMSDLSFGQTGFRFVKIELLDDVLVTIQNIFAVNTLPYFKREAKIKTSDRQLNKIIDTAIYTLKLNLQNGYILDGIKRDRLVWCGDLNQEIINSLYLFGDNINVRNSLEFLKNDTPSNEWMNWIPSYSAWWIINLCDYYRLCGNVEFFSENRQYALDVLEHLNNCISEEGKMYFNSSMDFFLDWQSFEKGEDEIGVAALLILAANKFLEVEENSNCYEIKRKLIHYLGEPTNFKQIRAFQILAGKQICDDFLFFEKGLSKGFSTFMAYYILTANVLSGGEKSLDIIKEYFGAMLSRGATTFWEDFDIEWLRDSGRIDEFTPKNKKDLHADYGNHCYKGLRHSLCHGWSSGVLSFLIESVFGIRIEDGGTKIIVKTKCNNLNYNVKLPLSNGWLKISYKNGILDVKTPKNAVLFNE